MGPGSGQEPARPRGAHRVHEAASPSRNPSVDVTSGLDQTTSEPVAGDFDLLDTLATELESTAAATTADATAGRAAGGLLSEGLRTVVSMVMSEAPVVLEALDEIETAAAQLCGQRNAITARLVDLIVRLDADALWESTGARSLEHWVAWKCGMSTQHAMDLVTTARRAAVLPETMAGLAEGVISEDQVAVIARRAPDGMDHHFATLAHDASVSQLRTALRIAQRAQPPAPAPAPPPDEAPPAAPTAPTVDRTVSTWFDDFGVWHARVQLPIEEGAYAEQALQAHKDALVQEWKRARSAAEEAGIDELSPPPFPTTADAFLRLCERGLDVAARARPHCDRTTVILHLDVESRLGELHLGPALTDAERRYLACDATFETWFERDGEVIGAARATRKIPRRLRRALERRDRCCRVPGCGATAGLHAHHIVHWEDGGPTELWNVVLVCPFHHRLHHRGGITIRGPADRLEVRDRRDRLLSGASLARPPEGPFPDAPCYRHVPGERAQWKWYDPPVVRRDAW